MHTNVVPQTADQLGHAVFHRMIELSQVSNHQDSTSDDIEAARLRLVRMHNEISDALWDNTDVGAYEAGLRSAIATHLNACASVAEQRAVFAPLQPAESHALRENAHEVRAGLGTLGHLEAGIREALASFYEAKSRLGEELRNSPEPALLIL